MANITLNWKIPVGLTWVYSIENGDECTATSTSKYLLYQLTNDNIVITARKQVESGNKVILTNNITGLQLIFTLGEKQVDPGDTSTPTETTTIYWGGTSEYGGASRTPIPADFDYITKKYGSQAVAGNSYTISNFRPTTYCTWVAIPTSWRVIQFTDDFGENWLAAGQIFTVNCADENYKICYWTTAANSEVDNSFTIKVSK